MARDLLDLMIRAKTPSWQRGGEKFGAAFTRAFTAVAERKWQADADFERMKRQADFRVGPEAEEFEEFRREQDILGKEAARDFRISPGAEEEFDIDTERKIRRRQELERAGIGITPTKVPPIVKEKVEPATVRLPTVRLPPI